MLNFDWLLGIPNTAAKWIFLILFIIIGILVTMLPRDYILQGVEEPRWWHNLKLWAYGLLAMIFVTYLIF
jgi:hypothetical protein